MFKVVINFFKIKSNFLFKFEFDRFTTGLVNYHPFLNDIISRASIILNNSQFQNDILNQLCSQVVKTHSKDSEELQKFVKDGCSRLKLDVSVDKLKVPDVLMQCEVPSYDEMKPCKIFISQIVSRKILFLNKY